MSDGLTVIERDERRWTLKRRHTSAGRYLEAYGPWVYDEDPIEVVPAEQLRGAVIVDDAAIERAADALAAKLHWLRDFDRARELARAALHAAAGGQ